MNQQEVGPLGSYDAVWVPRKFGGSEYRLKLMPLPEDLIIQQYLLNEILTERWDRTSEFKYGFSRAIPAVRYYREERKTITTGLCSADGYLYPELQGRTLSFAYQIDMDVLEGRQPSSDQGMFRPYVECWRDFMASLVKQASEIGYVHAIRLDVKRYYDRLRRYVVRDRILGRLRDALNKMPDDAAGFAELMSFLSSKDVDGKAAAVLDYMSEHIFGVPYLDPDTGDERLTDQSIGIPQGPVISAWIGSVALFPVDEEANNLIEKLNADKTRIGYARYVDDIVLLADSAANLAALREVVDRRARELELVLIAKADEIPPMSAVDFAKYINEGRALAASGPAWEPPLTGDGESGWEFWSVGPATDRQSALLLLHNIELYKANSTTVIYDTIKTALQAQDLRTSELPKAARLIWYALAIEHLSCKPDEIVAAQELWNKFFAAWQHCTQAAGWRIDPEKNSWEAPILFALEGLERLIDTKPRDFSELSAIENEARRSRIIWLSEAALLPGFDKPKADGCLGPAYQRKARLRLVQWKARRALGKGATLQSDQTERARLFENWHAFNWMHGVVELLSDSNKERDPLSVFVVQAREQLRFVKTLSASILQALLPDEQGGETQFQDGDHQPSDNEDVVIALQTLIGVVPRQELPARLIARPRLLKFLSGSNAKKDLILPPFPGVTNSKIILCKGEGICESGEFSANGFEVIELKSGKNAPLDLSFSGGGKDLKPRLLRPQWIKNDIESINGALVKLNAELPAKNYLRLRERVAPVSERLTSEMLRHVASLFRIMAAAVLDYSKNNQQIELVPAWPYIAHDITMGAYYLVCDGVPSEEIAGRAFVRDGGRSLRTVEVPIYEASLWRIGIAITDYVGLHDDVAKFSDAETDVMLDAAALADPARYVLRCQLKKLRGAFADSHIGLRRSEKSLLPMTVERSLRLLESFPLAADSLREQINYILAADAESAAMWLAMHEQWQRSDSTQFLKQLAERVLGRLPLSIGESLSTYGDQEAGYRRDFYGLLCFVRRLDEQDDSSTLATLPAWKALRAGVVCKGISLAIGGIVSSMRSHGGYERYENFDFPAEWEISASIGNNPEDGTESLKKEGNQFGTPEQKTLTGQLRQLIQHLGHRIVLKSQVASESLSFETCEALKSVCKRLAVVEVQNSEGNSFLDWPFSGLTEHALDLLNADLMDSVAELVKRLDRELGFEVSLVCQRSYGLSPQTRRFTDSKNGVSEITPWFICQFPRKSRHVEEIVVDDQIYRRWSEVFDKKTGKLLSVSVLGEPFASIAIPKKRNENGPVMRVGADVRPTVEPAQEDTKGDTTSPAGRPKRIQTPDGLDVLPQLAATVDEAKDVTGGMPDKKNTNERVHEPRNKDESSPPSATAKTTGWAREFRRMQRDEWMKRAESDEVTGISKLGRGGKGGHIRVALLQADFGLTYNHPLMEVYPLGWPFDNAVKHRINERLKSSEKYTKIFQANNNPGHGHLWDVFDGEMCQFQSWSEYKRRRILKRVIDACEAFGVDVLVLSEYSVRRETIDWLKNEVLPGKRVAVLAGTYMDFRHEPSSSNLAAPLTLLWPLPSSCAATWREECQRADKRNDRLVDALHRGLVLEFSRAKKYRSIALEEFFRPHCGPLSPLFMMKELVSAIEEQANCQLSAKVASELLANSSLPLKYFFELICSEIFLVSSPANYKLMANDYASMLRRFGLAADMEEVKKDLERISSLLNIIGNGIEARRSILAVPAATTRSADYWIAGQSTFLAAGVTTVFCNAMGVNEGVGGSCFIGRGSWKNESEKIGYISKITPYHGWTKGIYYNNENDALSKADQALVIADVDPHNMLEGKPRAQTMPSPLQLVAYLPLVKTVDWIKTESSLLRGLEIDLDCLLGKCSDSHLQEEEKFWGAVREADKDLSSEALNLLWKAFPDKEALMSRARVCNNNMYMQPASQAGSRRLLGVPAYYDWIDVSFTLESGEELPEITVPAWKRS